MNSSVPKSIWIDLDNSPHVPFFRPVIDQLERLGYRVVITARDSYQVCELIELYGLRSRVLVIGTHWGKRRTLKIIGTLLRAMQLVVFSLLKKPDLAVAHGSRAQVLCCSLMKIPCAQLFDYEFASGTGGFKPDWVFAPDLIPESTVAGVAYRYIRYPGLKEDVYIHQLKPDPFLKSQLGVAETDLLVTVRPPASEAHYHNSEAEILFDGVLEFLTSLPDVQVVLVPRNNRQTSYLRMHWNKWIDSGKIIIPNHAVDGANLIWLSDFVVSGGGTMNREAAALGVPVYSIFRGHIGAVDRYLADKGRLTLLENLEDVRTKIKIEKRVNYPVESRRSSSAALDCIVNAIVSIVEKRSVQTSN